METIISLVVVGVIYSAIYVVKRLISKSVDAAAPVMGESFPHIEVLETEERGPGKASSKSEADRRKIPEYGEKESRTAHENRSTSDSSLSADDKPKGKRFSISDKSEAKRAFIYAEIFNRKYQ